MRLVVVVLMWSAAASVIAQSGHAFKSVDADGAVSYSDTRPTTEASVEQINIGGDSKAIEAQGQQRVQELNAASERLAKERAEEAQARGEYQTRLAEAREEIAEAERNLATTRQSRKHATPERIALAEQRVHLARQRMREVQSAGP